ncbi:hypothetical protein WSS_A37926 [Rhodococcus opacus M213]|uniref:dUTPase n=3 Tax=Rhodococcus opacus TaxID=37919 RepID=K8X7A3_RHOOP|nr:MULTISPECIES: DUF4193 domain-containing protein [Rhodococcus]ANS26287.1 hypothetical protein R1CP_07830 [Rhodococcus opacus]EID77823.1 hypothetical protein W59_21743 [Rhodococcus opacus RKJ300 = JCM 13270]EKT77348.1 hypothetical protein WSS_A37926 [Rhodococcus opacus M213]QQZ12670.1 DUF4193 domain-containing protein [Rhodococcus sp. 21391]GLK38055.1 dUTPase [Rhodococcus wratislaviensis]
MITDYDAPRRTRVEDIDTDESEELVDRRLAPVPAIEEDADDAAVEEAFELPGADLSGEGELRVRVLPRQADEFVCSGCFLVQHRSRLAATRDGMKLCRDCAT